jgi:site-specific DNA-methyltransferase (adenine-specific)
MTTDYLQPSQPDILEVIANLSNDQVFTPPRVASAALNLLPEDVWGDSTLRWLDPGTKSGVFLREITKRLMVGLADEFPDETKRLGHILKNMVFGLATEEVTAMMSRRTLYCSKDASGGFSAIHFANVGGNIWHQRAEHDFDDRGKCRECGGTSEQLEIAGRDNKAYGFIHADGRQKIEEEMDMKFDVIVGNPPYQMDADGGNRTIPLYNIFVDEAKRLNPKYVSMIIPSRWMAGGLGLNDFRSEMLGDQRLRKLSDFSKMELLFPGVDFEGGVCYFLWDRDNPGPCEVTYSQDKVTVGPQERDLGEFDIFVRDARGLAILEKVLAHKEPSFVDIVAADKEFGMTSNFSDFRKTKRSTDVALHYNRQGARLVGGMSRSAVPKSKELIDTWKVLIPEAYGERGTIPAYVLGPTLIAAPPSVCTQTYLFAFTDSETMAKSIDSYIQTRFARFLISLRKISQHATRGTYAWVPQQKWNKQWTDEALYKKYDITEGEQAFIAEMVRGARA